MPKEQVNIIYLDTLCKVNMWLDNYRLHFILIETRVGDLFTDDEKAFLVSIGMALLSEPCPSFCSHRYRICSHSWILYHPGSN